MLAPFQGLLQVVRIDGGDAESTDGRHWVLYVAHPDITTHTGLSELRYGDWSAEQGLHRAVVRGTQHSSLIEQIGERLVAALEQHASQVPFELADRHECWLMDQQGERPLVLIGSTLRADGRALYDSPRWQPGSAALQSFPGIDDLQSWVAERAGPRPKALWIERQPDAGGIAGDTRFDLADLPWSGFCERWEAQRQALVERYLDWLAPILLQLPQLSTSRRQHYEAQALARPKLVEKLHRLYPAVIDRTRLNTALVAARLIEERPVQHYEEPFYWPE
jgi:hypothetical protein